MTKSKLRFCGLTLGVVCVGCVSDPYITDSLTKLDRFPMHCRLPERSSVVAEPLPKEKLLGEWDSGVITAPCRHIDGDGIYDSGAHLQDKMYGFFADGSYCMADSYGIVQKGKYGELLGKSSYLMKCMGKWGYENGFLTLNTQHLDLEVKSGEKTTSHNIEKCNRTNTFKIICYDDGTITIEEKNPKVNAPPSMGDRELVTIDNQGVRTERTIKVTGIKAGKEVGVIDEKIIPPTRFKRQKNHE